MSITTEIQRLRTNVNNIRQNTSDILDAIANKGVTVPDGSTLDDCAGLISQIETGGNAYFNCDVATSSNIAIMKSEDKIRTYFSGGASTGGFVFPDNFYNADIKNISLNISYYRSSSGGTDTVVGYRSSNSNYNNGRLFTINHDKSSGVIVFQHATSSTSWSSNNYTGYTAADVYKLNVEIQKNGANFNMKFFINGVKKYDADSIDYTGGMWSPTLFANSTYSNVVPGFWGLKGGEYIVMSETSLYIDDKKIFGT